MGWAVGYDTNWQRDIGYGVPAKCDHPDCDEDISRGLAHVCGGEPYGGDHSCGLFFCDQHLYWHRLDHAGEEIIAFCCERCVEGKEAFDPKPDTEEWTNHKMTCPTWAAWREENGIGVATGETE